MVKFLREFIILLTFAVTLAFVLVMVTIIPSLILENTYLKPFINYCQDHNWEFRDKRYDNPVCLEVKNNLVIEHPLSMVKGKVYEVKQ